ncbi:MAG: STAS domain-containing protein [SAR324 cluster bacterium]|nr:STAS domain-containing protein [SAR324 cluster bacterium]
MNLTHRLEGSICIIKVEGKLNIEHARKVRSYIDTLLNTAEFTSVVMDLQKVTTIDSLGEGVIFLSFGKLTRKKIQLVLCHPVSLSMLFNDTYIHNIIPVYASEEEAIAHCNTGS